VNVEGEAGENAVIRHPGESRDLGETRRDCSS
jgi:hypothetical protein